MDFKEFITNLVQQLHIDAANVAILTSKEALNVYRVAFVQSARGVSEDGGQGDIPFPRSGTYEMYEQHGDPIIKLFMTFYFYRRFPQLWKSERDVGVKIVARLMIRYGSREVLSTLADQLGFWPYISTGVVTSADRKAAILEDVFEAFIGATDIIIDTHYKMIGFGYHVCYRALEHLFNNLEIKLDYNSLFDSKTRLKELVDFYKEEMGRIQYNVRKLTNGNMHVGIEWHRDGGTYTIGKCEDILRSRAEQEAAQMALQYLEQHGYSKPIPREYQDALKMCFGLE